MVESWLNKTFKSRPANNLLLFLEFEKFTRMVEKFIYQELAFIDDIRTIRNRYFDQLPEAQELYLELMIRKARIYSLVMSNHPIGYFILSDEGVLLEYFVMDAFIKDSDRLLGRIIGEYSIRKALCKSFDFDLLSALSGYQTRLSVLGINFREYRDKIPFQKDTDIDSRIAGHDDAHAIFEMNEEVFETDSEVYDYIDKKQIFIFKKEGNIVGFGIFACVIDGRPEYDIGMLVNKNYRKQGIGTYIIQFLVNHCRENGWRPICGCAIENTNSRKCLEKAGFIGRYRLLEFVL